MIDGQSLCLAALRSPIHTFTWEVSIPQARDVMAACGRTPAQHLNQRKAGAHDRWAACTAPQLLVERSALAPGRAPVHKPDGNRGARVDELEERLELVEIRL